MRKKRIGFLGGTFDPPHLGHLKLAQSAVQNLNLDDLIFSVASISPAKQENEPIAGAKERLQMVQLMIQGQKRMQVSDFEVENQGLSYTIDLVKELRRLYPEALLYMIVSSDVFSLLGTFKELPDILKECTVAVGARSEKKVVDQFEHISFGNKFIDISSTQLRLTFKNKPLMKQFLPTKVFDFILAHRLYL